MCCQKLMSKRRADEKVLNSSFWFYVYVSSCL